MTDVQGGGLVAGWSGWVVAGVSGAVLGYGERSAEADHREREAAGGADARVAPIKAVGRRLDPNDRRCSAYLRGTRRRGRRGGGGHARLVLRAVDGGGRRVDGGACHCLLVGVGSGRRARLAVGGIRRGSAGVLG